MIILATLATKIVFERPEWTILAFFAVNMLCGLYAWFNQELDLGDNNELDLGSSEFDE